MLITRRKNGDTIVEVLIAMAVVALVLGGAYASSNRSLSNTRASQERSEAIKVAESQFEGLSALSSASSPVDIFDNSNPVFCLDENLGRHNFIGYNPAVVSLSSTDFSRYPSECFKQGRYYVSIIYSNPNPPQDKDRFNVIVRWDHINGGRDEINAVYRVHKTL